MSSFERIYRLSNISNSVRQKDPGARVRVIMAKAEMHWNSTASKIRQRSIGGPNLGLALFRNRVPSPTWIRRRSHLEPHHRKTHRLPQEPHSLYLTTSSFAQMPNTALQGFFDNNGKWADAVSQRDSVFFQRSAEGQQPKVLWIGCADSRVPESVVMACKPGEVFVHRNIAKWVVFLLRSSGLGVARPGLDDVFTNRSIPSASSILTTIVPCLF